MLGFAGAATLPGQIRNVVSQTVERIGVDKSAGIWDSIARVVAQDHNLLQANAAVLVYKERGSKEVTARKIGRHSAPLRPWGVEFRACATPGCQPEFLDFYVRCEGGMDVRLTCRRCSWQSEWVKSIDRKNLIFNLDSTMPSVFWHEYPPTEDLQRLFVNVSREKQLKKAQAATKEPGKKKGEVAGKQIQKQWENERADLGGPAVLRGEEREGCGGKKW